MNTSYEPAQILHSIIRNLNGSSFAATIGDFYRGEIAVLNTIHLYENNKEKVFPSMISDFLHISRPTVTSSLGILEKKKLIQRNLYTEDRRKVSIELTDLGKDLVNTKNNEIDTWCTTMASHVGSDHLIALLLDMKKIVDYMA